MGNPKTAGPWLPGLRKGVSDYDATHAMSAVYVAALPFGRNKKFFGQVNRAVNAIIGGWQFSGVYHHTTALPTFPGNGLFCRPTGTSPAAPPRSSR